jgi:hypothetical protein
MQTDNRVKTAKPQEKLYKLADERGLHLSVYPNGLRLWQMRYRFEGKEKTASLGKYPKVSLAEARDKRDQMRRLIANDIDPVQSQKAAKEVTKLAQAHSFEAPARTWFEGWRAARSGCWRSVWTDLGAHRRATWRRSPMTSDAHNSADRPPPAFQEYASDWLASRIFRECNLAER